MASRKRKKKTTRKKSTKKTTKRKSTRSKKKKSTKKRKSTKKKSKRKSTKRKTTKRKSTKRKTTKRKSKKRKTTKRKSTKRKSTKRKTTKRKTTKRKSSKRKKKTTRKAKKRVEPIPAGYHTVTPQLILNDAAGAIEFYKKALGAKDKNRFSGPDGKVMHAAIKVGDSIVMLADEGPPMPNDTAVYKAPTNVGHSTAALFVYVRNVDKAFEKAVKAGCTVRMPVENQFWGDRYGQVIDPYGHTWAFATQKEKLTNKQIAKRMEEAFAQMAQQAPQSEPAAVSEPPQPTQDTPAPPPDRTREVQRPASFYEDDPGPSNTGGGDFLR